MVKGYEFQDQSALGIPSWYRKSGKSAGEPDSGSVIELSDTSRDVTGIGISILPVQPPFTIFWTYPWTTSGVATKSLADDVVRTGFLPLGGTATFSIEFLREEVESIEAYGSAPGIAFADEKFFW